MLRPKHRLARLQHLHKQLLGLLPSALVAVRRRQVGHAGQRVWMLRPKHRLARLQQLYVHRFCCFILSLLAKC